jgi:hypothetical protein
MIVGIDLGTTHSLIGRHSSDGPRLFPNAHGELLTPSVVSLDGDVVLGQPARDRLISHPSRAHFKRWMGNRETRLGDRVFRPEELALVLRSLLADAEAVLGQKVEEAVISVPAYFPTPSARPPAAGELAGIRVERLINEPTAAALSYGLQQREEDARVLVLDLGGGTFDVSILELFEGGWKSMPAPATTSLAEKTSCGCSSRRCWPNRPAGGHDRPGRTCTAAAPAGTVQARTEPTGSGHLQFNWKAANWTGSWMRHATRSCATPAAAHAPSNGPSVMPA